MPDDELNKALELARGIIHGPLPGKDAPQPSLQDALDAIQQARKTCGFNWLTGESAAEVLKAAINTRRKKR